MAQQSTYLLNNITSTQTSALQPSNNFVLGKRAFDARQRCYVSLTDKNADVEPSIRQHSMVHPLCNPTSASSNRPFMPPDHDNSPSNPRSLGSPSISTYPPDLFSDLLFPPPSPPIQSPNITPLKFRHQNPRFPGDLYTPIYTRNDGPLREGWCGFCRPGRWLVLKKSAFWYDKCFGHGICAATGARFEEPETTRPTHGRGEDVEGWEGRCGTCGEWIVLTGGKRSGVPWFRHAYKVGLSFDIIQSLDYTDGTQCHTHAKVPSTPKKNRQTISMRSSKPATSRGAQAFAIKE